MFFNTYLGSSAVVVFLIKPNRVKSASAQDEKYQVYSSEDFVISNTLLCQKKRNIIS